MEAQVGVHLCLTMINVCEYQSLTVSPGTREAGPGGHALVHSVVGGRLLVPKVRMCTHTYVGMFANVHACTCT